MHSHNTQNSVKRALSRSHRFKGHGRRFRLQSRKKTRVQISWSNSKGQKGRRRPQRTWKQILKTINSSSTSNNRSGLQGFQRNASARAETRQPTATLGRGAPGPRLPSPAAAPGKWALARPARPGPEGAALTAPPAPQTRKQRGCQETSTQPESSQAQEDTAPGRRPHRDAHAP